jgi:hypothetical protein
MHRNLQENGGAAQNADHALLRSDMVCECNATIVKQQVRVVSHLLVPWKVTAPEINGVSMYLLAGVPEKGGTNLFATRQQGQGLDPVEHPEGAKYPSARKFLCMNSCACNQTNKISACKEIFYCRS